MDVAVHELFVELEARRVAIAEPLWHLPDLGQGSLEDRVARFVEHRIGIYELAAPTIRAAFSMGVGAPAVQEQIERRREQAGGDFALELAGCDPRRADEFVASIEALGQFDSLELLRAQRRCSVEKSRRVLVTGVTALLRSCH